MTWFTFNRNYTNVYKDINKQRDRGAAIIASAILEDHLLEAIKSRLRRDADIENKLFSGYGPLASFSAKVDLGYLLGLYDDKDRKDFHTIREIRNEFAHNLYPISFRAQKDKCAKLLPPKGITRAANKAWREILKA